MCVGWGDKINKYFSKCIHIFFSQYPKINIKDLYKEKLCSKHVISKCINSNKYVCILFSPPGPKGHVSYRLHFASVVGDEICDFSADSIKTCPS